MNTSELLERFNAQLGTTVLVSGEFVDGCCEEMKKVFRLVDRVKGKRGHVAVYSFDLDTKRELDPPEPGSGPSPPTARERAVDRAWRKRARLTSNMYDVLNSDNYYLNMREKYSPNFIDFFNKGLLNYLSGEWAIAKESFDRIKVETGVDDQVSTFILSYMQKHQYESPKNWDGFRPVAGDSL